MKTTAYLTLSVALYLLAPLPAFAGAPAPGGKLKVHCDVPGFQLKLDLEATLEESRPEDHIELFTIGGSAVYSDFRGDNLEFTHIPVNGTFDNSRGVTRIHLRPGVPLMFGTFSSINITQFKDGYQLFDVYSSHKDGPHGGSNGQLCTIEL